MIHDTLWTMPTPIEDQILVNVFPPPETAHEAIEYAIPANFLNPANPIRPKTRPPPPPFNLRPEPPVERPGYFPVPRGIRAVFTTPAVLLRSQPGMNRPRRTIAPRIRQGMGAFSNSNVVDDAHHWARRLNPNPELNPSI